MEEVNSVESLPLESVLDDAAQAPAEEAPEVQEGVVSEEAPKSEPGWIKQRVGKAVDRAVREAEARVRAEYEAMLAPIREDVMDRQARELVASGEFKSVERAKEYVQLKNGVVATAPEKQQAPAQARDAQGRFASAEDAPDAKLMAKAELLVDQAAKINSSRGIDVMQVYNDDPDVQSRVLNGEWDFYDVADYITSNRRTAPSPMRTSNGGGSSGGVSIANMTDAQFRKLQENLANGRRYDVSK